MTEDLRLNWARTSFGDVVTLINGRAYKQHEMLTKGTPILRIQNLNGGANWFYSDLALPPEKYCSAGDLLYAWSATFGPYMYAGPRAIFHYHIWNVKPTSAIHQKFAFYELLRITDAIKGAAHGVAMPHITKAGMEAWPLDLPPLAEQQRIADKLDTVLARVDACRDRLARVAPLLKRFRQSVLACATSGRLTSDIEPAFGSRLESLARLGAVSGGLTKNARRDELPMRRPYLRVANVRANELRLDDVTDIGLTDAEFSKTKLVAGDLLIVEGNGSIEQIGRVAMWSGEIANCCHQNHLIRWRAGAHVLPKFVLFFLLSPEGRRQIEAVASSTTGLHTLSVSKVGELQLPVPELELQAEIVRRVEALFAFADRLEARLTQAQTFVDRLTPSLLAKAFRGELVPQDPADEPAADLLKRLQASAVARPAPGRARRRATSHP